MVSKEGYDWQVDRREQGQGRERKHRQEDDCVGSLAHSVRGDSHEGSECQECAGEQITRVSNLLDNRLPDQLKEGEDAGHHHVKAQPEQNEFASGGFRYIVPIAQRADRSDKNEQG